MWLNRSLKRLVSRVARSLGTLRTFRIEGPSMTPNLHHGDRILVRSINYPPNVLKRRDVVVVHDPRSSEVYYIKRVIGLPGEHISIKNKRIHINDIPLEEPYLLDPQESGVSIVTQWILPESEYLVLGDNRNNSRDSRQFGPISSTQITGRAMIRYWPPGLLG